MSQRTEKRLLYEDIIKHVAKLLIQDDNLSFLWKEIFLLCKAILFKLGQDQFMKDFRRLLECFYLDLLHHATTDLERATSHVLRSQLIRDIRDIGLNVEQSISTVLASFFRAELVKSPKILSDPYQGGKVNSDEDKDDDNDEMDDWTARAVPDFTEMRRFMIGSNAFRNLVTSCRTLLLPPHLRSLSRVIMTIPDNRLWFSEREDLSIANKFKAFAEQLSNEEWCWWPLRPRMRSLQKDETRLHWQCVSDVKFPFLTTNYTKKAILALRQASLD